MPILVALILGYQQFYLELGYLYSAPLYNILGKENTLEKSI